MINDSSLDISSRSNFSVGSIGRHTIQPEGILIIISMLNRKNNAKPRNPFYLFVIH
jgi:hypothetical protein